MYVMGEDVVEQEGDIERTDLFAKSEGRDRKSGVGEGAGGLFFCISSPDTA